MALLGLGLAFLVVVFICNYEIHNMGRLSFEIVSTIGMCFAWCFFYGTQWAVGAQNPDLFLDDYVLLCVITAMICSGVAFAMIFIVDTIADLDPTLEELDEALR